jgi:hypothetical protein
VGAIGGCYVLLVGAISAIGGAVGGCLGGAVGVGLLVGALWWGGGAVVVEL